MTVVTNKGLIKIKCDNDSIWNISNCECEYRKKAAKLISEEYEEINDNTQNKTVGRKL